MTIADLRPGTKLGSITLPPVDRLSLIKYAGVSGDYNPIHTIDEEAEKAGLPGIIAHGMWTMGSLGKLFSPYLNEWFIRDYSVRFKGMVFLGDVLTLEAAAEEMNGDAASFLVSARNQNGEEVVSGKVRMKKW
ncbi:MaoC/PaaZ C-terminal domain-containing protein [Metabacillus indicus]|uniref:MaoC/PaaZ C-terminal domain-containing protein n=1 Tax=Metabacillus indicus TaxID=246786 RepID=UPI002A0108C8|nr:MaoC/PaaZ C-terminal domain-containing protein [Metabacillus indicus]MDX8288608.1 MaoC/PaaZ C-terminal domain-containing protein [Metabacillus indicus]